MIISRVSMCPYPPPPPLLSYSFLSLFIHFLFIPLWKMSGVWVAKIRPPLAITLRTSCIRSHLPDVLLWGWMMWQLVQLCSARPPRNYKLKKMGKVKKTNYQTSTSTNTKIMSNIWKPVSNQSLASANWLVCTWLSQKDLIPCMRLKYTSALFDCKQAGIQI